MSQVIAGRHTSALQDEVVVFLIGMRLNSLWRVHKWMPIAMAMPRMIKELESKPELGFLGAEAWFGRTTVMLQYWRSLEHLHAYAHARQSEHLPAWKDFNKRVGASATVGIWHETYRARPQDRESVYVNMPAFALGRAGGLIEATGAYRTAKGRMQLQRQGASGAAPPHEQQAQA